MVSLVMLPLPFPAATISLDYGAVDGEYYTFSSPHQGTDFSSRSQGVVAGSVIRASGPGVVTRSGVGPEGVSPSIARPNEKAGNSIDVDYGDVLVRYMHRPTDSPSPAPGDRVTEGTSLGVIGATGLVSAAHLHMETWSKTTGRRVDPANYFDFTRTVTTSTPQGDTARPFEEDDMAGLIQHKDRGIALIAPGYFKAVTPEELQIAVARYGWPKVYDDSPVGAREFDLDVSLAVNGSGGDQQVQEQLAATRDQVLAAVGKLRG